MGPAETLRYVIRTHLAQKDRICHRAVRGEGLINHIPLPHPPLEVTHHSEDVIANYLDEFCRRKVVDVLWRSHVPNKDVALNKKSIL